MQPSVAYPMDPGTVVGDHVSARDMNTGQLITGVVTHVVPYDETQTTYLVDLDTPLVDAYGSRPVGVVLCRHEPPQRAGQVLERKLGE
jgi:hypothetical protein